MATINNLDTYSLEIIFNNLSFDSACMFIEVCPKIYRKVSFEKIIKKTDTEEILTSFLDRGIDVIYNNFFDFRKFTENILKYTGEIDERNPILSSELYREKVLYDLLSDLLMDHPNVVDYVHPNVFKSTFFKINKNTWEFENPKVYYKINE